MPSVRGPPAPSFPPSIRENLHPQDLDSAVLCVFANKQVNSCAKPSGIQFVLRSVATTLAAVGALTFVDAGSEGRDELCRDI